MLLCQFAGLQVLDAVTTLWFLHRGVAEANPLMGWALAWGAQPVWGLAAAKALGLAPALWAWHSRRHRLLRRINLLFAACVAWNLAAGWLGPSLR
ncbi:MAG: DUF5658 family protein [Acidobacteriia bacterium]|nr:DUF5658 family protein [Terriglobia bacterium]